MRTSTFPVLIVVGALLLCGANPGAMAQSRTAPNQQLTDEEWWFGFHLVEMLFKQKGLIPLSDAGRARSSPPEETVLIILGRTENQSFFNISRFVRDGGAVLVATDRTSSLGDMGFLQRGPLIALSNEAAYLGFPDCPRITDLEKEHPLMRGVNELIVNRSGRISRLSGSRIDWSVLARCPESPDPNSIGAPVVGAGESRDGPGKIAVLSDHSLLTNGMLWHGDNAIFAINLVEWLAASGRKKFLFLTDGQVGSGPLPPPELPEELPPLPDEIPELTREEMLMFANKMITGMEDEDIFNQLATSRLPFLSDSVYWRSVLLLLALVAALFLIYRLMNSHAPVARPLPERGMPTVTDLKNQQRIDNNAYELAARQLAEDFLAKLTGAADPRTRPWSIRSRDVEIHSNFFLRSSIRADLSWVLQIANSDRQKFTKSEVRVLLKAIRRLDRLHQQGRLQHPDIISTP
ncbi:MAG: hypothetical protein KDA80_09340 [Planctomycetaceae bacterium]|nr:hypothetical protein [Planctomycetaceae bacterium]